MDKIYRCFYVHVSAPIAAWNKFLYNVVTGGGEDNNTRGALGFVFSFRHRRRALFSNSRKIRHDDIIIMFITIQRANVLNGAKI